MPRPITTREGILAACRRLMVAGNFRPTAAQVVRADGFSERSIRQHFGSLESLYMAAIDGPTAHAMVNRLPVHDEIALARVLATGRVIP